MGRFKRRVDRNEAKGQYFLTGSQNLSILKSVAESMAGRVAVLHLDTMTPLELMNRGRETGWLPTYLKNPQDLLKNPYATLAETQPFTRTLWRGSLPASIDLEDQDIPIFYKSYLSTYIPKFIQNLTARRD